MTAKILSGLIEAALISAIVIGCRPAVVDAPKLPEPSAIDSPPASKPKAEPTMNDKLLRLHNTQRELKGRVGLSVDASLNEYADRHARWMASKNNLKHSDIGVLMGKWHTAGENIAWNQQDEEEVVDAWMHSSGHRANILNRSFSKVGFGMALARDGSPYWCTVFAD